MILISIDSEVSKKKDMKLNSIDDADHERCSYKTL